MSIVSNNIDLKFFRRFSIIGAILLTGITVMNITLETDVIDFSLPRMSIAASLLGFAFSSYFIKTIRDSCMVILYVMTTLYMISGIYVTSLNHFPIYDTSADIIIFYALGALFKRKRYLIIYLVILYTFFMYSFHSCTFPKITSSYLLTSLSLLVILAYIVFSGKIDAITELTKSQQKLKISGRRFKNIFEQSPVGIIVIAEDFKISTTNKNVETMLNLKNTELVKIFIPSLIHPDDLDKFKDAWQQLASNKKESLSIELRFIKNDYKKLWARLTMANIEDIEDGHSYMMAMIENITLQKETDIKLLEYSEKLKSHNQALQEFSYVISHDLQEPLRMIKSYTQIIQKRYMSQINNKEAHIDMGYVIDGAQRMSNLIKDMLAYSRWSAKPFESEVVNSHDVLVDVLKNLSISIRDNQAEVYSFDMPNVDTNSMLLGQVFQNLIGNGLKYSHQDRSPIIEVFGEQREKDILFTIKDNGLGFEEKDKDRIFGIFQRLHGRNSSYTGTGIGLAICKRIIEKQGGKIWANGEKEKGATFYFTIPYSTKQELVLN